MPETISKRYRVIYIERYRSLERELLPVLIEHYEVLLVRGRRAALATFDDQISDLVLVDVPSIRFDLTRFCTDVKACNPNVALFLLLNTDACVDDFPHAHGSLRRPFTARQLLNRLTRFLPEEDGELTVWEGLKLDAATNSLAWGIEEVFLTPKQAALLLAFFKTPETTLSRAQLMQDVWGTDFLGDTRTLDVHIHWLRKALTKLACPMEIQTVRGVGYCLRHLADTVPAVDS